jgi:hypothetical protein
MSHGVPALKRPQEHEIFHQTCQRFVVEKAAETVFFPAHVSKIL